MPNGSTYNPNCRFGHAMIPDATFLLKNRKDKLEPKPLTPNDLVFGWPQFRSGLMGSELPIQSNDNLPLTAGGVSSCARSFAGRSPPRPGGWTGSWQLRPGALATTLKVTKIAALVIRMYMLLQRDLQRGSAQHSTEEERGRLRPTRLEHQQGQGSRGARCRRRARFLCRAYQLDI